MHRAHRLNEMHPETSWLPGQADGDYAIACVWEGVEMEGASDVASFEAWMQRTFRLSMPLRMIGAVATLGRGGGRSDWCFLVHNADIAKLATPARLQLRIRWLDDALSSGGERLYPAEFLAAYGGRHRHRNRVPKAGDLTQDVGRARE